LSVVIPEGTTNLDEKSQKAVCTTSEQSMGTPAGSCQYVSSTLSAETTVLVKKSANRFITAINSFFTVKTTNSISLLEFPAYLSDPTSLYNALTVKINNAVSSGNFTHLLQTVSIATGATITATAKCNLTITGNLAVVYTPSYAPTPIPTPNPTRAKASYGTTILILIIVAVILGLILIAAIVYCIDRAN
jgi:hypothetical protein